MILSGYPLDTLWVSHEGKKKTVIGVPKDETPIGTLRHFPSTLRGKKKKLGFYVFLICGSEHTIYDFFFFQL